MLVCIALSASLVSAVLKSSTDYAARLTHAVAKVEVERDEWLVPVADSGTCIVGVLASACGIVSCERPRS